MTVEELKTALVKIIGTYYKKYIVWSEQSKLVKPDENFMSLKLDNIKYDRFTVMTSDEDGFYSYRSSSATLEVQLFSHGETRTVEDDGVEYEASVNTALNDILDLVNFLTSDYANALYEHYDIAILPEGYARDITGFVDTNYEYRAIQEFTVYFTQTANGDAGISRDDWKATASGGGTQELADRQVQKIDAVDIENKQ